MAHTKSRGNGKYLKGNIDESTQLGTLAARTLISEDVEAVTNRVLVSSIVCNWSLDGIVAGQGPIIFGVAHSDYTDAQIEAVLENTGSWSEGDLTSKEIADRKVRQIGQFVGTLDTGTDDIQFNDGKPVKTKLNWILNEGNSLTVWAWNASGSALSTADPAMICKGHANLWVR